MIKSTLVLLVELVILFFGVSFLVHLSQSWLGEARLRRWMGGPPIVSALKGIAVGFVTPFCTYSAIPMLVGLRKAGVSPAGYVAFIVAAPVLDPILFGALVLIVGIQAAVIYAVVAFTAALSLALTAQRLDIERHLKPVAAFGGRPEHTPGCDDTACGPVGDQTWQGLRVEIGAAAGSASRLLKTMGPILVLGVAIGVSIELLVPPDFVASIAGGGSRFAIPVAAGLGTPLYINTELFVPIADSLAAVGVGVGAIVALTIAGAGANIPEFVILGRLAKTRLLAVFVGYVFAVAIVGGLLTQTIVA